MIYLAITAGLGFLLGIYSLISLHGLKSKVNSLAEVAASHQKALKTMSNMFSVLDKAVQKTEERIEELENSDKKLIEKVESLDNGELAQFDSVLAKGLQNLMDYNLDTMLGGGSDR